MRYVDTGGPHPCGQLLPLASLERWQALKTGRRPEAAAEYVKAMDFLQARIPASLARSVTLPVHPRLRGREAVIGWPNLARK